MNVKIQELKFIFGLFGHIEQCLVGTTLSSELGEFLLAVVQWQFLWLWCLGEDLGLLHAEYQPIKLLCQI